MKDNDRSTDQLALTHTTGYGNKVLTGDSSDTKR